MSFVITHPSGWRSHPYDTQSLADRACSAMKVLTRDRRYRVKKA